jgi:hypothetical protein
MFDACLAKHIADGGLLELLGSVDLGSSSQGEFLRGRWAPAVLAPLLLRDGDGDGGGSRKPFRSAASCITTSRLVSIPDSSLRPHGTGAHTRSTQMSAFNERAQAHTSREVTNDIRGTDEPQHIRARGVAR